MKISGWNSMFKKMYIENMEQPQLISHWNYTSLTNVSATI